MLHAISARFPRPVRAEQNVWPNSVVRRDARACRPNSHGRTLHFAVSMGYLHAYLH